MLSKHSMWKSFFNKSAETDLKKKDDEEKSKKILLHTCCAVCFGYPSQLLQFLKYDPVVYFYNPNIFPEDEFIRRKEELGRMCEKYNFELITEDYSPEDFSKISTGLENEPEKGLRCEKCFELRLLKTAQKAKELGIESFTTTLTVSPHKDSGKIFEIANEVTSTTGIAFEPFDFKKNNGFKLTQEIAKFNKLYKQSYCGCEFSIRK